jgi:hypothetical protein
MQTVNILKALRYGVMLTKPETWKTRQNLINALVGVLSAVVIFLPEPYRTALGGEVLAAIATAIAAVVGLVINPVLTTATTEKIGLAPEDDVYRGN